MSLSSKGDWTWHAVSQRIVKWVMKFPAFAEVIELVDKFFLTGSAFLKTIKIWK